jgi:YVTN family beta-propeller protein
MGPSGRKVYVLNSLSNTVSVVDLTQRALIANISVEGTPVRGTFNRNGDRLYIIGPGSPNVSVIDPLRFAVIEKVFIGTGASAIRTDPRTGLILVGKEAGGEVSIIDPSSSMFIDTIEIGGHAAFMAIDDEENDLFIAIPERRMIQKVNLTSKRIVAELEVREGAYAVVLMGER